MRFALRRPRVCHALVGAIGAICACNGGGGPVVAFIATGVAVAHTALYRHATGACWAHCMPGTECDEPSGLCIPAPCADLCPADYECVWVEGEPRCVAPPQAQHFDLVMGARRLHQGPNEWLCLAVGIIDCIPPQGATAAPPR